MKHVSMTYIALNLLVFQKKWPSVHKTIIDSHLGITNNNISISEKERVGST